MPVKPFEHLIYHYRLGYSGWRYAQIIQGGESFVALSEGLQNAFAACGGVPQQHRTDSLSAAYRNMGGRRSKNLTRLYDELCDHYRLEPTRNNKGVAHENGSIESPHGHLKNRIKQAIYLRGSADFTSVAEYQALIDAQVAKLNQQCQTKYEQEKDHLQPLPKYRTPDYEVLTAKVSKRSTIDVRCILYTVPSRLNWSSIGTASIPRPDCRLSGATPSRGIAEEACQWQRQTSRPLHQLSPCHWFNAIEASCFYLLHLAIRPTSQS